MQGKNQKGINVVYMQPLKLIKVNIGSEERLKLASIGDYWNEQMMSKQLNNIVQSKEYIRSGQPNDLPLFV